MAFVRDILNNKSREVHTIDRNETVYAAIERMETCRVGALVVTDGTGVCGMMTERDYLRKVALKGRSSRTTRVEEIMSAPVLCARPEDSVDQCMATMTERRCRHLPVVDKDQRLVGLVSIGDLVKHLVLEKDDEISHLHRYIQGQYPG